MESAEGLRKFQSTESSCTAGRDLFDRRKWRRIVLYDRNGRNHYRGFDNRGLFLQPASGPALVSREASPRGAVGVVRVQMPGWEAPPLRFGNALWIATTQMLRLLRSNI